MIPICPAWPVRQSHAPCMHQPLARTHLHEADSDAPQARQRLHQRLHGDARQRLELRSSSTRVQQQRHGGTWSGAGAGAGAGACRVDRRPGAGARRGGIRPVAGRAGGRGPARLCLTAASLSHPTPHFPHPTSSTRTCPWRTHQTLPCPPHTPTPASTHLDVGNVHREVNRLAPHL